jgi:hypothetical protein
VQQLDLRVAFPVATGSVRPRVSRASRRLLCVKKTSVDYIVVKIVLPPFSMNYFVKLRRAAVGHF